MSQTERLFFTKKDLGLFNGKALSLYALALTSCSVSVEYTCTRKAKDEGILF